MGVFRPAFPFKLVRKVSNSVIDLDTNACETQVLYMLAQLAPMSCELSSAVMDTYPPPKSGASGANGAN